MIGGLEEFLIYLRNYYYRINMHKAALGKAEN